MIKDSIGTLNQRTTEQIQTDLDLAVKDERYEDAAKFRDEMKNKSGVETPGSDILDKAQSLIDEAAAEEKHKKETEEATKKEEQSKEAKIKELTEQLNNSTEKNEGLENKLNLCKAGFAKIREDRKNKIDEIKNSNTSEIDKLKDELKKLKKEKEKIENDLFGKVNFKDDIKEDDIKKITSRMLRLGVTETDKRGRKTGSLYERMPIRMTRRRITIKTMAKKFNQIKDNPTQGVDFIMAFTKTRFGRYSRQEDKMSRRSMLRHINVGRNLETFGVKYNKQKEKVMTVLTGGSKIEDLPPEEQVVLKAIEQRMDYYGKKYLKDIYNQNGKEKIK